jgi:ABC-2 type transport system ATP-binding protein
VADRVGIIRHGRLVEVATVADLKAKAVRGLELEFSGDVSPSAFERIDGVREVSGSGRHLTVSYDGPIEPVLEAATQLGVVNLHSQDADLEQIFLAYYRDAADVPKQTGDAE